MPRLGLSKTITGPGIKKIITPVSDNRVLYHRYNTGSVVPVSDGAVILNGTSEYIDCGNGASLQIGATSMTYTAWVKSNGGDGEYIISKRNSSEGSYSLYMTSNDIQFFVGTQAATITTSAIVNNGLWHHVAAVYEYTGADDANVYLYIDGVLEVTDTSIDTDTNFADDQNLYIGWRVTGSSTHYWDGNICNVGFWSGALTQAQIKSIMWKNYAGLLDSEKTNLVSWWNLSADANDSHGSNNGTLS